MERIINSEADTIGQIIKKKRKEKRMTQTELAQATGLSLPSITKYEQGVRVPKLDALKRLDKVLELGLASYFTESSAGTSINDDEEEDVVTYEVTYRKSDGISTRTWIFKYDFTGLGLSERDKNVLAVMKACDNRKPGEVLIGFKVKDQ